MSFAGQTAPYGYLLCNGASYKVADYPDLYAVIGSTYGGDSTNFNVPNLIDKFIQGSATSGTEKEAGLPNITGYIDMDVGGAQNGEGAFYKGTTFNGLYGGNATTVSDVAFDASKSNPIYGNSDTVQPPALTMVYIIKAFHTNEGVDSGVSDDVVEYVDNKVAEVETALPNIKKFANPSGTARYITISGTTLGDIEVHSAYAGKYMFTSTGAKPIFFGTSAYLGYTLTGWAWSSDKTKLYLRVNGHRDFVISAFGSDGVEISDMTTTAPEGITFNATFETNALASDINPTIDISKVFSNGALDISTLCGTYGNGRYVIVGQGTAGNGSATIDIWTLASQAISYIVNVTYSNKTSNTFIGLTYENPTVNFETNYLSACNHIAKVCTLA